MRLFLMTATVAGFALASFAMNEALAVQDTPTTINGVEAVCTGVGSAKDDPRWSGYPVKLEFSNAGAQFLSGENVKLMDRAGQQLAEFDCTGPWVLLELPKGSYSVTASIPQQNLGPKSATFETPASGQKRVEIQFPAAPPNQ